MTHKVYTPHSNSQHLEDWKLIKIQHTFQTKKQKIKKDVQGEEHLWKNTPWSLQIINHTRPQHAMKKEKTQRKNGYHNRIINF